MNSLAKQKAVYAAFVDFCKAFDFVDRELLFRKMVEVGLTGHIFEAVTTMYTGRSMQ